MTIWPCETPNPLQHGHWAKMSVYRPHNLFSSLVLCHCHPRPVCPRQWQRLASRETKRRQWLTGMLLVDERIQGDSSQSKATRIGGVIGEAGKCYVRKSDVLLKNVFSHYVIWILLFLVLNPSWISTCALSTERAASLGLYGSATLTVTFSRFSRWGV